MNYSRRRFVSITSRGAAAAAAGSFFLNSVGTAADKANPGTEVTLDDPGGVMGHTQGPVAVDVQLPPSLGKAADAGTLVLREAQSAGAASAPLPVQPLAQTATGSTRLCWLMPPGNSGRRVFFLEAGSPPASQGMVAGREPASRQFVITEAGKPVLQYNYAPVEPGEVLSSIAEGNRKYAVTRSDYIHPLYGLQGETLTKDWSKDHPHHRGIYWAWPEVDWRGRRGDLHALQKVFARPTGHCVATSGPVFGQIEAENLWHWEDGETLVRERAILRAYCASQRGRVADLVFEFEALGDPVQLARRDTSHYGGLNVRLNQVKDQRITKHTDPAGTQPRQAWSDLSGVFAGAEKASGLSVLQHAANPDYPGDWVDYPDLNWLQPTFPATGTRYELVKGKPLVLRFRLWIHPGGSVAEAAGAEQWLAANSAVSPLSLR
jgi:hypothetical protein